MKKGQKATFALLVLLLQTGASFDLATAPEPVAEPAKRGLFALFGR